MHTPTPTPRRTAGGAASAEAPPLGAPQPLPAVTLPKGGGAIRGVGEKFSVNPSTGSGSASVPLPLSPGRQGFGPQLALSYDTGAGNGVFGIGWSLGVPAITRKTDRGLPRYDDEAESDVFVLAGAEDLVPVVVEGADGPERHRRPRTLAGSRWDVRRYRPRTEGLFARVERWTDRDTGISHWRSITRDGVTTLYGRTAESRVADPDDDTAVFSWAICETWDRRGNATVYRYAGEDDTGVDTGQAHEANRTDAARETQRHLKRILYGNRTPRTEGEDLLARGDWLFEAVLDYGEHDPAAPKPDDRGDAPCRPDPFSTYRAGFEVRTYRLCRRVLMFHHFPGEPVGRDCLVRSVELAYRATPVASQLVSITQHGHRRRADGTVVTRTLPALELEYTPQPPPGPLVDVDAASLENLPSGAAGDGLQLVDLDGDGLPGILAQRDGTWLYKRNLSPLGDGARFGPTERVARVPAGAQLGPGGQQLLDVDGDGRLEVARFDPPLSGYYERTPDRDWAGFVPFASVPMIDWRDPTLRFVDLTGDGHADLLLTADSVLTWHPSLGAGGFGAAERVARALDEEDGPRMLLADDTQSVHLADLSGDGLPDLVRIRNGDVSYWPSLGYGRFGAKVTMDEAPVFDAAATLDHRRVRLADVDGSGPADLLYLDTESVRVFPNRSGNAWGAEQAVATPPIAEPSDVTVTDLLGAGTACLVWSSALPGDARRPMRYLDLMGGRKPHLLHRLVNNLGTETTIAYASSAKAYVADREAGRPWATRLPFPVQVVERVETYDAVSRNRFVTRHAYHHGHFDGDEREFRGFGLVEQWDTAELGVLQAAGPAANVSGASHVAPLLKKTWFHTGAHLDGPSISRHLASEYYAEPLTPAQREALVLPDTRLPADVLEPDGTRTPHELTPEEEREACRVLKGSILRQETYALDGSSAQDRPYLVSERAYQVELLQPRFADADAVLLARPRESVELHYERALFTVGGKPVADPRVNHALTLEVDAFGAPLRVARVAYGRRHPDPDPALTAADRAAQRRTWVTYTDTAYTDPIDEDDAHRAPLVAATTSYELVQAQPASSVAGTTNLFRLGELAEAIDAAADGDHDLSYEDVGAAGADDAEPWRRLVEAGRMLYRDDDLKGPMPLGRSGTMGHPAEGYRLAFTASLIDAVYTRPAAGGAEALIPDPVTTLGTQGGYARGDALRDAGLFPATDEDGMWWIPSGRTRFSPDPADGPAAELARARAGFFHPRRFEDTFGGSTTVTHDAYHLLMTELVDPVGNRTTAANDYRVLEHRLITDANGNRVEALHDAHGQVTATAAMGKQGEAAGDSLAGVDPDPAPAVVAAHLANPHADPHALLGGATTRSVSDLHAFARTRGDAQPQPVVTCGIVRETHAASLAAGQATAVTQRFSYSDGFARTIQVKGQAEPGPVAAGQAPVPRRWVGSGWTVFDNKGEPVRAYEPFFSATHAFELARAVGVSSIVLYDPASRPVALVHPNHTWEKVVVGPWRNEQWDVNDTVLEADPRDDPHVGGRIGLLPRAEYVPTWHAQRAGGALGADERSAARKAAEHARTPTVTCFDALGQPFVTFAHNRVARAGAVVEERYRNRSVLDVEGNRRSFTDARGRVVVEADFGLLSGRLRERGMDSGTRWLLTDAGSKPLYVWDSQGRAMRTHYDAARRPTRVELLSADGTTTVVQRTEYGEGVADDRRDNLRGRPYRTFDGAGVLTVGPYDFKGNARASRRELAAVYRTAPDWSGPVALEDAFTVTTEHDALNRPVRTVTPDGTVTLRTYNEAGLLESVKAHVRGAAAATTFVAAVDYDAKGQRRAIEYGNGVTTEYTYDRLTWRLVRQVSSGGAQDLSYVYDPAGNVCSIADAAQQTLFFNGRVVEPRCEYAYDATYQLVEATGREHVAQNGRTGLPLLADGAAMQRYRERYSYDEVGNLLELAHRGDDAGDPGWSRTYRYDEPSLVEPAKTSNRLSETREGAAAVQRYAYDRHGAMSAMPHLPLMRSDHADRLQASSAQVAGGGATPETTYYVYDADGDRVRKVTEGAAAAGAAPRRIKERIYASGIEVYREHGAGPGPSLERETLPVLSDTRRVALVETRTAGADPSPAQLVRFQLEGHLGSSAVELTTGRAVISYEEYYPYGGTSFQAVGGQTEVPKRYRWSAKECDEESGLYRYGERYYAAWLGRWTSCDPAGATDSPNVYRAFRNAPTRYVDPTGRENEEFDPNPAGSGYARRETAINVDESKAVGEPGISKQESMRRAKDLGGRQFLDQTMNSATKGAGKENHSRAPLPPTSVKENPGALLSRPTLGGIKEWDELSAIIMKEQGPKLKGKTAQQVKEILNSAIREELKAPKTAPGKVISEALSQQLNVPAKDMFTGKTIGKAKWKPRGGGRGKAGAVVAAVVAVVTLNSAEAQASEFHVEVPQGVKEGKPMTVEEGAMLQVNASVQVADVASMAPGGLLAAAFSLAAATEGLGMMTDRKMAEVNHRNLKMVENAWLMINPSTGEVFAIGRPDKGGTRGEVTSIGRFDRYVLLQGQYWRGGEVIQKDANDRYWLGEAP